MADLTVPEPARPQPRRGERLGVRSVCQRLDVRALYGPTGRNEWVGPVGEGTLEPFAYDKPAMERLWELSEKETGCTWEL